MSCCVCITVELSKLVLKPGDALILKLPPRMSASEVGRSVDCARAALGSNIPILVMPSDVEVSVLEPGQSVSSPYSLSACSALSSSVPS